MRKIIAAVSAVGVSAANAAVPAEVTAAFTTMATDFGTLLAAGVTLAVVVWGGYLILANGRKMLNKTGK